MNKKKYINDVIGWDVKNWSKFLDFCDKFLPGNKNSKCLEIGTGPGGLTIYLAKKMNKIICSDFNGPGETAISLHKKYNIENKIEYKSVDLLSIPLRFALLLAHPML